MASKVCLVFFVLLISSTVSIINIWYHKRWSISDDNFIFQQLSFPTSKNSEIEEIDDLKKDIVELKRTARQCPFSMMGKLQFFLLSHRIIYYRSFMNSLVYSKPFTSHSKVWHKIVTTRIALLHFISNVN